MSAPAQPIKYYRHALSGHSHRVELFLSLLGLPFETVDVDLGNGAHKAADFLAKHPFGKVPVIEDGDVTVWDSTAILVYLARKYDGSSKWAPQDPEIAARVQAWLGVAADQVSYGPAAARLVTVFGAGLDADKAVETAYALFNVLETQLEGRNFIAAEEATIADIALYSYIAHAPEGNVSLDNYANIRSWLRRIEALPGFVGMQKTAVGLAA